MTFLRLLAQPYLAAAPSGISASGADGVSGHLEVDVAAVHGSGEIEVAWSEYTLGAPVVSSSCAATTTWDPDTSRLQVAVPPGQACRLQLSAG